MKKIVVGLLAFLGIISMNVLAVISESMPIDQSQQLIVVLTKDWNHTDAKLQLYSRESTQKEWHAMGSLIDVVVGKNGLAWKKKEGDGRTPSGIFPMGNAFGFAAHGQGHMKMHYLPILSDTVCVDDMNSKYYNHIIHSAKVNKSDWNSGEKMATVSGYHWGAVINYNINNPVRGAGSCIFMHIWKARGLGTAGCVAMEQGNVKKILEWLDPAKKPLMVVLPENEYKRLQNTWRLPKAGNA